MPVTGTATTEANAQIDAGLNYVAFWSDLSAFADQGEDFKLRKSFPSSSTGGGTKPAFSAPG
jgi:hypothetical protein